MSAKECPRPATTPTEGHEESAAKLNASTLILGQTGDEMRTRARAEAFSESADRVTADQFSSIALANRLAVAA